MKKRSLFSQGFEDLCDGPRMTSAGNFFSLHSSRTIRYCSSVNTQTSTLASE